MIPTPIPNTPLPAPRSKWWARRTRTAAQSRRRAGRRSPPRAPRPSATQRASERRRCGAVARVQTAGRWQSALLGSLNPSAPTSRRAIPERRPLYGLTQAPRDNRARARLCAGSSGCARLAWSSAVGACVAHLVALSACCGRGALRGSAAPREEAVVARGVVGLPREGRRNPWAIRAWAARSVSSSPCI